MASWMPQLTRNTARKEVTEHVLQCKPSMINLVFEAFLSTILSFLLCIVSGRRVGNPSPPSPALVRYNKHFFTVMDHMHSKFCESMRRNTSYPIANLQMQVLCLPLIHRKAAYKFARWSVPLSSKENFLNAPKIAKLAARSKRCGTSFSATLFWTTSGCIW